MQKILTLKPTFLDTSDRLDIYLSKKIPEISRSRIKKLIDSGKVLLNSLPAKAGQRLRHSDTIFVTIPEPETLQAAPENIPLDIIYEDRWIVVVNKPAGMVVHSGAGNTGRTLASALLYHCRDLSGIGGVLRPGIVHRLDKDTSGVIAAAKNDKAHLSLAGQFKGHTVVKKYIALVWGVIRDDEGVIDKPIGRHITDRKKMSIRAKKGRSAVTYYRVLKRFNHSTLIEVKIKTGRTHQIRVHLAAIHHPVMGDNVYGYKKVPVSLSADC